MMCFPSVLLWIYAVLAIRPERTQQEQPHVTHATESKPNIVSLLPVWGTKPLTFLPGYAHEHSPKLQ